MNDEVVFAAVADARRAVADLIDTLTDDQLQTPSLCAGWDVKTVAAHLVSVFAEGFWTFQWQVLRRGGLNRAIDALARRRACGPADEIAATLRSRADHRLSPPVTGPLSGLTDVLVHTGDITIPLGLPFRPEAQRAEWALDFLTGPRPLGFVPRGRLRGIALCSSELDRTWGRGAEIHGPTGQLMMAAAGRAGSLDVLDGPGVAVLRQRIGG
ncbi:maleylpyruvate isomerase family mycothiol-dependent enzyme [Mycolicibacterium moriokaense]|nr:maleylpyruvate isomerase family mycothiol-dependent enzyme [Mycolicibacterium moriokaense]